MRNSGNESNLLWGTLILYWLMLIAALAISIAFRVPNLTTVDFYRVVVANHALVFVSLVAMAWLYHRPATIPKEKEFLAVVCIASITINLFWLVFLGIGRPSGVGEPPSFVATTRLGWHATAE